MAESETELIPERELRYVASPSSGPGGQNVNKVATRVTVLFDLEASSALSPEEKERVRDRLGGRISARGLLRVSSQRHRTQAANRREARGRLEALVAGALVEEVPRRPTSAPRSASRRRLAAKRHRGRVKRERRVVDEDVS